MKNRLILGVCLLLATVAQAQFKTQTDYIKEYTNGTVEVYKNDLGKMVKQTKLWPIEFIKNAKGQIEKIMVKRAGVIDVEYKPDLIEQPGYFSSEDNQIVFLNGYFACYTKSMSHDGSSKYNVLYTFVQTGKSPLVTDEVVKELASYYNKSVSAQSEKREEIAKDRAAQELADRTANNLPGKDVKSLEVKAVSLPSGVGNGSTVDLGVIITLKDGTILKTKNLGGKTEFTYSFEVDAPGCTFADGMVVLGYNAALFTNDEVKVTFKGLDAKKTTVSHTIKLNYQNTIKYDFIGDAGSSGSSGKDGSQRDCARAAGGNGTHGQDGYKGPSFNLKVKESTIQHSGAKVYLVELKHDAAQEVQFLKVNPVGGKIYIESVGGMGGSGGTGGNPGMKDCINSSRGIGGNGGNGGNGGDVTIIRDSPSIQATFVTTKLTGGVAGYISTSNSGGRAGNRGNDGKIYDRVEKVYMNW